MKAPRGNFACGKVSAAVGIFKCQGLRQPRRKWHSRLSSNRLSLILLSGRNNVSGDPTDVKPISPRYFFAPRLRARWNFHFAQRIYIYLPYVSTPSRLLYRVSRNLAESRAHFTYTSLYVRDLWRARLYFAFAENYFLALTRKPRCVEIAVLIMRRFMITGADSYQTDDEWPSVIVSRGVIEWRYLSVIFRSFLFRTKRDERMIGQRWSLIRAMRPKSCSLFLLFCVLLPGVVPFTSGEGK